MPGVRFHTLSGKPARARLAAMADAHRPQTDEADLLASVLSVQCFVSSRLLLSLPWHSFATMAPSYPVPAAKTPGAGTRATRTLAVLEAIDEHEALELLRGLIAQPSENPPGNEESVRPVLVRPSSRTRASPAASSKSHAGRPNLYATVGGHRPDAGALRPPRHRARGRRDGPATPSRRPCSAARSTDAAPVT